MASPIRVLHGHEHTVYAAVFAEVRVANSAGTFQRLSVILSAGQDRHVSGSGIAMSIDLYIPCGMCLGHPCGMLYRQIRVWGASPEKEGDLICEFPTGTNRCTAIRTPHNSGVPSLISSAGL